METKKIRAAQVECGNIKLNTKIADDFSELIILADLDGNDEMILTRDDLRDIFAAAGKYLEITKEEHND